MVGLKCLFCDNDLNILNILSSGVAAIYICSFCTSDNHYVKYLVNKKQGDNGTLDYFRIYYKNYKVLAEYSYRSNRVEIYSYEYCKSHSLVMKQKQFSSLNDFVQFCYKKIKLMTIY